MTGSHTPSPEFRARLEGEIVRSYRSQRRGDLVRRFRSVTLVVVALMAGAAAGAAPARVQEARQRSDLLAAQQAELRIAQMRLEVASSALADAQQRYNLGVAGREALAAAETEVATMQAKLRRIAINIEEIEASGIPPLDDISAPVVDGRDFVTERLRLGVSEAQQRMVAAEGAFEDVERRHRLGSGVSSVALAEAEVALQQARSELAMLAETLDLREQVLQERLSAAESQRRLQLIQARHEWEETVRLQELASERLENLKLRAAVGRTSELEVKRAEVELLERQVELEQIHRRIRELEVLGVLRRRMTDPDTSRAR